MRIRARVRFGPLRAETASRWRSLIARSQTKSHITLASACDYFKTMPHSRYKCCERNRKTIQCHTGRISSVEAASSAPPLFLFPSIQKIHFSWPDRPLPPRSGCLGRVQTSAMKLRVNKLRIFRMCSTLINSAQRCLYNIKIIQVHV